MRGSDPSREGVYAIHDPRMGRRLRRDGLMYIAFEGYEIIAQTSEEVEDPKRNVPRAVFLSLLIVIPITSWLRSLRSEPSRRRRDPRSWPRRAGQ